MTGFIADEKRCLVVFSPKRGAVVFAIEHELFLTLELEQRTVQVFARDIP